MVFSLINPLRQWTKQSARCEDTDQGMLSATLALLFSKDKSLHARSTHNASMHDASIPLGACSYKGTTREVATSLAPSRRTQKWAELGGNPCVLAVPRKGDKIRRGHLTPPFLGAHKWGSCEVTPAFSGVPNKGAAVTSSTSRHLGYAYCRPELHRPFPRWLYLLQSAAYRTRCKCPTLDAHASRTCHTVLVQHYVLLILHMVALAHPHRLEHTLAAQGTFEGSRPGGNPTPKSHGLGPRHVPLLLLPHARALHFRLPLPPTA